MDPSEFYALLESRKSIRKFKTEPIEKEKIERILGAATQAPSGKNRQNWKFFVLQGEKRNTYLSVSQKSWISLQPVLKKRLKPSLYEFTERFFFTLGDAPVVILVYSENAADEKYLTSIGSVYMAVENLLLAALVEGLGTCTMGAPLEIETEVNDFLGLTNDPKIQSKELQLLCAVVVGKPDHNPPKAPRQTAGKITWL